MRRLPRGIVIGIVIVIVMVKVVFIVIVTFIVDMATVYTRQQGKHAFDSLFEKGLVRAEKVNALGNEQLHHAVQLCRTYIESIQRCHTPFGTKLFGNVTKRLCLLLLLFLRLHTPVWLAFREHRCLSISARAN